jgi:ribosomal protein L20
MVRVKRGNVARNRRNKILKIAKGFRGTHSKLFRMANQQVMKALRYSYVGRKRRKRESSEEYTEERKIPKKRIRKSSRLFKSVI